VEIGAPRGLARYSLTRGNHLRPIPTRPLTAFALVFLFASEAVATTHVVYTYRDAEGVSHFSNEPLPGAVPFDVRQPRDRAATAEVERSLEPIIREYAEEYRVEAALVKAVIRAESGFDANAVSERGASGLMQLMPATAHRHGVTRLHDPRENIRGGVRYLRTLLDRYDDDPRLALAAYNAGTARVTRYHGLPPYRETRRYVVTVLRFRREYSATSAR